ncbi:MAG: autotransporter-associated beta strand repeat-containing protein [Verrucomicrobiaceae bacterium]|nr:autotransporter-associated beta strand repeat-containing protein [Verrucomicrobiaceae bacterium]
MLGSLRVTEGASEIKVTNQGTFNTVLNLQDRFAPSKVFFDKASTVLFNENHSGEGGFAAITLAGQFGVDVQVVLPRATYKTSTDNYTPGVNYFAFVDASGYNVVASDNISIGGTNAHTTQGNIALWQPYMEVTDGALSIDAFRGNTASGASASTIRLYNSDFSRSAAFTAGSATVSDIETDGLVVGQTVRGELNILDPSITYTILSIDPVNDTVTLSSPALQSSTTKRLYASALSRAGTFAANSNVVTGVDTTGLEAGMMVSTTATALNPAQTYTIVSVDSTSGSITLSGNALFAASGASLQIDILNRSTVNITDTLTLTNGAILQTTHAGLHNNSFIGGTLTSGLNNSDGATADLIIHNWNPARPLTIQSTIADNASSVRAVNLVHTGDGTTVLAGANTYTGNTYLQGGVLRLESAVSLPSDTSVRLDGGVLGINTMSATGQITTFNRSLGTGPGQVSWTSSGGFAAYGVDRTVNLGGSTPAATLTWGSGGFVPDNDRLILGAQDADKTLIFANSIDLGRKCRMVDVISGLGAPGTADARITGTLTSDGGTFIKVGLGVLELQANNTAHTGGYVLAEGTLVSRQSNAFGVSPISVATTTDTRATDGATVLEFRPTVSGVIYSNNLTFGSANHDGVSVLQTNLNGATFSGDIALDRPGGRNVLMQTASTSTVNLSGLVSGTGGLTINGGGTVDPTNAVNTFGTLTGASGAAVDGAVIIRNGTLSLSTPGAIPTTAVLEMGDSVSVLSSVAYATNGASVLGVDRDGVTYAANNSGALGGVFVSDSNGVTVSDTPQSGTGGFYNLSSSLFGVTFTTSNIGTRILVKDEINNPERNGIYQITQFNADGTMNLGRVTDFNSSTNMLYGSQVTVTGGAAAGTYFMAAPSVTSPSAAGTDPVHWLADATVQNVRLSVASGVTSVPQAIDINGNGTLAGTTTISSATPVTLSGPITLQNQYALTADTAETLRVESTATGAGISFTGIISEAVPQSGSNDVLSIMKVGTGTATLAAANTYSGGTTVNQGSLFVTNTSGSGTGQGSVTVLSEATLGGNGIIAPAAGADINVNSGAFLSVGTEGSLTAETLQISLQNGSDLNLAGTLKLDLLLNQAGNTLPENDLFKLTTTGTQTVNLTGATLKVSEINGLSPSTFVSGDSWKIIDWGTVNPIGQFTGLTGTMVNDPSYLPDLSSIGQMWDISALYTTGVIFVAPEPSRVLMFLFGFLALGFRRRRPSKR